MLRRIIPLSSSITTTTGLVITRFHLFQNQLLFSASSIQQTSFLRHSSFSSPSSTTTTRRHHDVELTDLTMKILRQSSIDLSSCGCSSLSSSVSEILAESNDDNISGNRSMTKMMKQLRKEFATTTSTSNDDQLVFACDLICRTLSSSSSSSSAEELLLTAAAILKNAPRSWYYSTSSNDDDKLLHSSKKSAPKTVKSAVDLLIDTARNSLSTQKSFSSASSSSRLHWTQFDALVEVLTTVCGYRSPNSEESLFSSSFVGNNNIDEMPIASLVPIPKFLISHHQSTSSNKMSRNHNQNRRSGNEEEDDDNTYQSQSDQEEGLSSSSSSLPLLQAEPTKHELISATNVTWLLHTILEELSSSSAPPSEKNLVSLLSSCSSLSYIFTSFVIDQPQQHQLLEKVNRLVSNYYRQDKNRKQTSLSSTSSLSDKMNEEAEEFEDGFDEKSNELKQESSPSSSLTSMFSKFLSSLSLSSSSFAPQIDSSTVLEQLAAPILSRVIHEMIKKQTHQQQNVTNNDDEHDEDFVVLLNSPTTSVISVLRSIILLKKTRVAIQEGNDLFAYIQSRQRKQHQKRSYENNNEKDTSSMATTSSFSSSSSSILIKMFFMTPPLAVFEKFRGSLRPWTRRFEENLAKNRSLGMGMRGKNFTPAAELMNKKKSGSNAHNCHRQSSSSSSASASVDVHNNSNEDEIWIPIDELLFRCYITPKVMIRYDHQKNQVSSENHRIVDFASTNEEEEESNEVSIHHQKHHQRHFVPIALRLATLTELCVISQLCQWCQPQSQWVSTLVKLSHQILFPSVFSSDEKTYNDEDDLVVSLMMINNKKRGATKKRHDEQEVFNTLMSPLIVAGSLRSAEMMTMFLKRDDSDNNNYKNNEILISQIIDSFTTLLPSVILELFGSTSDNNNSHHQKQQASFEIATTTLFIFVQSLTSMSMKVSMMMTGDNQNHSSLCNSISLALDQLKNCGVDYNYNKSNSDEQLNISSKIKSELLFLETMLMASPPVVSEESESTLDNHHVVDHHSLLTSSSSITMTSSLIVSASSSLVLKKPIEEVIVRLVKFILLVMMMSARTNHSNSNNNHSVLQYLTDQLSLQMEQVNSYEKCCNNNLLKNNRNLSAMHNHKNDNNKISASSWKFVSKEVEKVLKNDELYLGGSLRNDLEKLVVDFDGKRNKNRMRGVKFVRVK